MPISSGPIVRAAAQPVHQPRGDVRRMQPRHHQHVGIAGQPAERIQRADRRLQRDVGAHFAVVFEIHLALVQHLHRVAHRDAAVVRPDRRTSSATAAPPAARGPAAGAPRRRADGDVGQLLGIGPEMHQRVGDEDRRAAMARASASGRTRCRPAAGSIACRMSSRQTEAERVRPVTIASASPVATMQAANTLRSWLTMRWQSRCRKPRRCSRV